MCVRRWCSIIAHKGIADKATALLWLTQSYRPTSSPRAILILRRAVHRTRAQEGGSRLLIEADLSGAHLFSEADPHGRERLMILPIEKKHAAGHAGSEHRRRTQPRHPVSRKSHRRARKAGHSRSRRAIGMWDVERQQLGLAWIRPPGTGDCRNRGAQVWPVRSEVWGGRRGDGPLHSPRPLPRRGATLLLSGIPGGPFSPARSTLR
jgi:hypothetical protein